MRRIIWFYRKLGIDKRQEITSSRHDQYIVKFDFVKFPSNWFYKLEICPMLKDLRIPECVRHYLKLSQQLISCFLPFS